MIRALRQRAERKQKPAAEAEVRAELRRLRSRLPRLTGALATCADGTVLADDAPGVAAEEAAALTTTVLAAVLRLADGTGRGTPSELVVRGDSGYLATYAAGRSTVLTLLCEDAVNLGRLHLEGRRSAARIGELVDRQSSVPPALDPAPLSPATVTAAAVVPGATGATTTPASVPTRARPSRTAEATAPTTHS
ncbi:roadblock/LC7 domain-containing protein [Streptomyces abyssomicinicus]|uniref:roadblock/LC7 domain-containing protein n=1 Tax=Streptomyces abyssomicinicus TaxID=574929 RepID=UPI0012507CED|nr:roadblock/LC7 domain-containing protein [Streptomyces abyssomicinicus]